MLCVLFDHEFRPIARGRKKTKGFQGADHGVDRMIELIKETIADSSIDTSLIAGLGIGCPGPVDMEKGMLLDAPNLGWKRIPLADRLSQVFGLPVTVGNDVDMGLYGEYRFGAAQGSHCAIGVFPGTGIGGACIYEGKILRGRRVTAMEIGHVVSTSTSVGTGTGRPGTLEAEASRLAIAGEVAKAAYRGEAESVRRAVGTDLSNIRSSTLAQAVEDGDKRVEQILRSAAQAIGRAVGGTVHLLAPDRIVLGGGLVEAMPKLFKSEIEKTARAWVLPAYKDLFEVEIAKLGDDATALGAAAWARHSLAAVG